MAGYVIRQFTCPKAVTHPSTNRARCREIALIETNALPLHQTANPSSAENQSTSGHHISEQHIWAVTSACRQLCMVCTKLSHYITHHSGQLSLPSLRSRRMSNTSYSWKCKGRYGSFRLPIERVIVQVKLRDPLRTRAIPERF